MCTTANEFFPRAQSEQPMFQQYRQYASPSNIHQIPAMYRGMAANSNTGNALPPRQNTLLNANAVAAAAAAGGGVSGNVARGYFDGKNEDFCYFLGDRRPVAAENNHNHNNNINNNLNNNVSNITNQLNNQITPLNPPLNNYADNFRRWIHFIIFNSFFIYSSSSVVVNSLSSSSPFLLHNWFPFEITESSFKWISNLVHMIHKQIHYYVQCAFRFIKSHQSLSHESS